MCIRDSAPVVRGKKGTHSKLLSGLAAEGFVRVRINKEVRELADNIELDKNQVHSIEVVVDRLIAREGIEERLTDSLSTTLKRGDGLAIVEVVPKKNEELPKEIERERQAAKELVRRAAVGSGVTQNRPQ